ncbi:PQQ-binding-like beta-propeller repeat protein [Actinoplanes subtropicus]|uniref:outer membrane protein assembly factor BamB family protein n=1 Tax=Actinoplanes subtropicus TaxID=543632 RepID=UPI0004C40E5F|nr:PQQ-binding-like beta-propeller repeat protein [Actinoplanes subtropicus]
MAVIDLGEVTGEEHAPLVPVDHRRLLRAALAVLSLAGLLVLTGSVPGGATSLRPLWTIGDFHDDDSVVLAGPTAYVSRLADGHPQVAAYDLAGRKLRWTAVTGAQLALGPPRPAGDTVLDPTDPATTRGLLPDGGEYVDMSPRTTVALDAWTGRELWRTAGNAIPSAGTGTALVVSDGLLRVVRLRDGGEIWRRSTPQLAGWTTLPDDRHPEAIATAGVDGLLSVYGYADGKLRATTKVPWETKTRSATLIPAGRNIAVIRDDPSRDSKTTVYSAGDLRPLWSAGYLSPCGELLCSVADDGVAGHDPDTGRKIWTVPGVHNMFPAGDNRVLIAQNPELTKAQLVDSRTGRPLGPPVLGAQAYDFEETENLYFVRPSSNLPGRLVVTRLDLADGTQTPLGVFGTGGSDQSFCVATRGYLACPRFDGLHVMAVD